MSKRYRALGTTLLLCGLFRAAFGQGPPFPPGDHMPPPNGDHDDRRGPPPPRRTPLGAPPGRWWLDPVLIRNLNLTPDQQKRIDDLYQQHRPRLSDLSAALQKEQTVLEPLLDADRPDENSALAQIDRVAQARADLEKASARMLFSFRGVLTRDQWKRLRMGDSYPPQR